MLAEGRAPPTWPPLGPEEFKFLRQAHGPGNPLRSSPPRSAVMDIQEFEFSRVELELENIRIAEALGRRQRETLHLQQHLLEIDQAVCQLKEQMAERDRKAQNTNADMKVAKAELEALWKSFRERQAARRKEKKTLKDRITEVQEDIQRTQWDNERKRIQLNCSKQQVAQMEGSGGGAKVSKNWGLTWRQFSAGVAEENRKLRSNAIEAEQRNAWLRRRHEELKSQGQSLREIIAEVEGSLL